MEAGQSHQKTQDSSSRQPLPKASPSHRPGRDLLRIAPCGLRLFLPDSSFLLCFPQRSDQHHSLKAHLNSSCLPFILSRCPAPPHQPWHYNACTSSPFLASPSLLRGPELTESSITLYSFLCDDFKSIQTV